MDASAAVDMSLLLVARLKCESSAKQVQIMSEWDPHPPFGGINWSRANGKPIIPILWAELRECTSSAVTVLGNVRRLSSQANPLSFFLVTDVTCNVT